MTEATPSLQPLFPPYLNQGSKGPAVNVLGIILKAGGYDPYHLIVLDGEYTPDGAITKAVMRLQRAMKFEGDEVDGHFGQNTRRKYEDLYGLNVDTIMKAMFEGETTCPPTD